MREIKFRAWNKDDKCMVYFDLFNLDAGVVINNGGIYTDLEYGHNIMQYTGLKDKNGRKIYEGDIVELNSKIMVCNWCDDLPCFIFGSEIEPPYLIGIGNELEVIGNIYENPELLKENG